MKYMVQWKLAPITPDLFDLAIKMIPMQIQYTKDLEAKGKHLGTYAFPGCREGMKIYQADSVEELHKLMLGNPFAPLLNFTVTPLLDFAWSAETVKTALEQMVQMMKK
jgi:muconolactone delta-isomerase